MAVSINKFRLFRRKNKQKIFDGLVNHPNIDSDDKTPQIKDIHTKKTMSRSTSFESIQMLNRIT